MPANKGAESKQGLIVTLVCFILLSIILAVTTYYGYADKEALVNSEKKAKDEMKSMEKNRDYYQTVALQLKSAVEGLTDQEKATLDTKKSSAKSDGPEKASYDKLIDLAVRLSKEDQTLEKRVNHLETDLLSTRNSLQAEKNNLAKEKAEHERQLAIKQEEWKQAKADLEKAQAANVAIQQQKDQELLTRLQQFGEMSNELEQTKKKAATDVGNLERDKKRLISDMRDQEEKLSKIQRQITPPDLQKFSAPKGKIVSVDLRSQLAYINLGSADNLRTQQGLTFSVFGAGVAGRASTVRKGALEVVEVVGPHLSRAKITETVDSRSNPIQPEDLLVNPAWSPTMQEHVAITGLIDLSGDGRDHIEEFMRALKRQNIVVDAYLDLKDATIKGKMDLKTDYLIVGEPPEINANTPIREGDPRFDRKTEILEKMTTMHSEAQRLGVSIVPLRRFVALTGYQLPRGARSTSGFSYESRLPQPSTNGEKEPLKKENAKEEKKEEGK